MLDHLPTDIQQRIQVRIQSGLGASEEQVLRQALDALEFQDQEVQAIQEGIEDLEAGRVRPLRDFDKQFRQQKNIPQDV